MNSFLQKACKNGENNVAVMENGELFALPSIDVNSSDSNSKVPLLRYKCYQLNVGFSFLALFFVDVLLRIGCGNISFLDLINYFRIDYYYE